MNILKKFILKIKYLHRLFLHNKLFLFWWLFRQNIKSEIGEGCHFSKNNQVGCLYTFNRGHCVAKYQLGNQEAPSNQQVRTPLYLLDTGHANLHAIHTSGVDKGGHLILSGFIHLIKGGLIHIFFIFH